jgi:flavin reductase (DIM6/NTAB) family NADH-FMN oxidoreductase RutF
MFSDTAIEKLEFNAFTKIGNEWALLAAGNNESGFNMMTASWAGFGVFWGKNAVTVYVRESRYTRKFFDSSELFTVSFLGKEYRKALNICGTLHGNECDKVAESGLTPFFFGDSVSFEESELIFLCRKMLHADFTRDDADAPEIFDKVYAGGDLHRVYFGEIVKVLEKN